MFQNRRFQLDSLLWQTTRRMGNWVLPSTRSGSVLARSVLARSVLARSVLARSVLVG